MSSEHGSVTANSRRWWGALTTLNCRKRKTEFQSRLRIATIHRRSIRQMMHRTVSPNLYMDAWAGSSDGGSEDDHGHSPRDDPPRSAHPRPPRNARAAATQFDSAARPDVSRVPGGESFSSRALPRRMPRRGGDGARTRRAGRRTKARAGGGSSPRRRALSGPPYP